MPAIIVAQAASKLKTFISHTGLNSVARSMMSCSSAESIYRGELTRFLARPRWQKHDFNQPLMRMRLAKEKKRGKFMFLIDATLVSQSGKKTQNTFRISGKSATSKCVSEETLAAR